MEYQRGHSTACVFCQEMKLASQYFFSGIQVVFVIFFLIFFLFETITLKKNRQAHKIMQTYPHAELSAQKIARSYVLPIIDNSSCLVLSLYKKCL